MLNLVAATLTLSQHLNLVAERPSLHPGQGIKTAYPPALRFFFRKYGDRVRVPGLAERHSAPPEQHVGVGTVAGVAQFGIPAKSAMGGGFSWSMQGSV